MAHSKAKFKKKMAIHHVLVSKHS